MSELPDYWHENQRDAAACDECGTIPCVCSNDGLCDELHTDCPTGYMSWHIWAQEKSKTHKQEKCPNCGKYYIWVPKEGA
jgi:hypothetical protein